MSLCILLTAVIPQLQGGCFTDTTIIEMCDCDYDMNSAQFCKWRNGDSESVIYYRIGNPRICYILHTSSCFTRCDSFTVQG